jgi:hypothetical protein
MECIAVGAEQVWSSHQGDEPILSTGKGIWGAGSDV